MQHFQKSMLFIPIRSLKSLIKSFHTRKYPLRRYFLAPRGQQKRIISSVKSIEQLSLKTSFHLPKLWRDGTGCHATTMLDGQTWRLRYWCRLFKSKEFFLQAALKLTNLETYLFKIFHFKPPHFIIRCSCCKKEKLRNAIITINCLFISDKNLSWLMKQNLSLTSQITLSPLKSKCQ